MIRISSVTKHETDSGQTAFVFNVTIPQLPTMEEEAVTVDYFTVDGTATVAHNDYVPVSGTITFAWNTSSLHPVTVLVNGDTTFEPNEVFLVELANPVNGQIIPTEDGVGVIYNDDVEPFFAINDVTANEGNTGNTPFTFTISRSGNPTVFSSVVTFSTANGTATAPSDYAAITNGTVTFAPNELTKTVTVQVVGDTVDEPNETFTVNLTDVTNGLFGDAIGLGTILNDEGANQAVEGDVVNGSGDPAGGDGVLSNGDAMLRQFALGLMAPLTTPNQFQRADVNGNCGDGAVNSADVTVVRQMVLGTAPIVPACGPTVPIVARPISLKGWLGAGGY